MGIFKGSSFTSRSDKITSFQSTVCEFGTPVPLLYGTCKVSPNLMCYQDFTTKERRTTQKSGKSKSTTITYLYYVYVELALGEGVISGINKVWVGDNSYSGLSALNANSSNEGAGLALNKGDDANPTTYMSTNHADIATGYSNLAYLYGKIFLGEDNASMPSYSFEVKGTLTDSDISGDGTDANPAYVIRDILTKIGLEEYIDKTSLYDYTKYCKEADLFISTPSDAFSSQKKAQEVIADILEMTNTYMFWSVDRFKFVVRDDVARGEWKPNTTVMYDLTADDFIQQTSGAPIVFKRKDSTEIYNYITVNFLNRANEYEEESVSYQDVDSIKTYGVRSKSYDAKWFHTKERALKYAQIKTRIAQTEVNQYTFKLPWKYCRLEPGDLLRITDEAIGFSNQVVMVSEITEDKTGILTVTAVQRADGDYSEAKYTVDNNYQYQDFNLEPGDTAKPLFITPPSDLLTSANGCEIWIALRGEGKSWGGCNVYASDKDGDYSNIGTQGVSSIYGIITSSLTADGTSVNIKLSNPRTVELLTGSAQDADNGNTLIWVNGECMSYTLATLLSENTYQLTGLIRGQYGTEAKAHAIGEDIALLDGGIYVVPLTKHYIGRQLYFKFPAFNEFKINNQNINELDYYTCTVATADLPNCTGVTAYNKYRDVGGTIVYHDIIVEWTPAGFENYQQAQIWYKLSNGTWQYGGSGYKSATLPQVDIGETYQIAVCTQDIYGNVETPDSSAQTSILVALSTETPNTPANLSVTAKSAFTISWDEVHNADVKYYEVRLDANVGVDNENFLARTSESSYTTNAVTSSSGTVYVFAVSAYGKISVPASVVYNFAKPSAPTITANGKLSGIECRVGNIPDSCMGVHWYFDGATDNSDDKTINLSYYKSLDAGVYEVKACYYNYFGDGTLSLGTTVTVKATIDSSLIEAGSIAAEKLDSATQKALDDAKQTAIDLGVLSGNVYTKTQTDDQISNSLANFKDGTLKSYATITQMNDAISLAVKDIDLDGNDIITKINIADGTILLDGKYIHVTGDTQFDNSIITNNMLAGSITADKLKAENIDLTENLTITGGNVKLSEEGLRLTNSDGSYTLFNQDGINYTDTSGIIYSQIKKMIMGIAYDGQYIKFASAWPQAPQVLVSPTSLLVNSADYSQNNIFIVCTATDITTTGFKVNCYSCLGTDTQGMVTINKSVTNYQVTGAGRQYTFLTFTIVVPATAGSITVTGYAHNVPWNSSDGDGYSKGHGVSNFYAEITGDGVTSCEKYHYGENTDADKSEWTANFSVTAKLSGATQVTFKAYGSSTDTNNWSGSYGSTGGLSISIPSATFDIAGDTIVSRGYANFIAIDSTNNTYNIQTTVKVLINYNGSPLALKTVYVDGTAYTTDSSGYIEMTGTSSKECVFAYSTAPTTTQTVAFSDGTITTVNISPADVTCYLRVTYDGTVITSGTVSVNGADMTPDSSGKIEIGGKDGDTGTYTVAYGNDSMTVTVTYTAASITTIALVSITDGSTTYTSDGTVTFTVPGGITRIQAVAEVYIADGPMGEEVNYSCTITDTVNSTEWGYGYSNSDFEEEGNTSHGNMNSVIAVTPNKQYNLKIEGTSDCTSGIKLSWGKDINKLTADVTDT